MREVSVRSNAREKKKHEGSHIFCASSFLLHFLDSLTLNDVDVS